jgi:hypothetical protein
MGTPLEQITRVELEQISGASLLGFLDTDSTRIADVNIKTADYDARGNPDGTLTISKYSGSARDVIIPQTIDNRTVTGIGKVESNLFSGEFVFNSKRLTSVVIPDTVRIIGNSTFSNNRIAEVKLPSSLEVIGHYAFRGNQIRTLVIPISVTVIELYAFESNPLATLTIQAPFTTSGGGTTGPFYGCPITRLTIPAYMDDETMQRNFETSLITFWRNQGRQGGTYVKTRNVWSLE